MELATVAFGRAASLEAKTSTDSDGPRSSTKLDSLGHACHHKTLDSRLLQPPSLLYLLT